MLNRDIAEVATTSLSALWDQETERKTRHEWVGKYPIRRPECIKCGLSFRDSVHTDNQQ